MLLALERGFKKEGCEFDFGGTLWLSGQQDEVDEKKTLLGNESVSGTEKPTLLTYSYMRFVSFFLFCFLLVCPMLIFWFP